MSSDSASGLSETETALRNSFSSCSGYVYCRSCFFASLVNSLRSPYQPDRILLLEHIADPVRFSDAADREEELLCDRFHLLRRNERDPAHHFLRFARQPGVRRAGLQFALQVIFRLHHQQRPRRHITDRIEVGLQRRSDTGQPHRAAVDIFPAEPFRLMPRAGAGNDTQITRGGQRFA